MENHPRDFKGIWIPAEIWFDRSLNYFEICLFSEIHSLNGKDGCFASNEYFCKFFNERQRKIQDGLAKLKSKGYIYQESFDGRTRVLRTNLKPEKKQDIQKTNNEGKNDKSLFSTSEVREGESVKSLFSTPDLLDSAPLTTGKNDNTYLIENKEEKKDINHHQPPPLEQIPNEKEKDPGGGGEKISSGDISYKTSSNETKSISQTDIYRHFLMFPYPTETVTQAISIMKNEKAAINSPLKYLESITKRLASKSDKNISSSKKRRSDPPPKHDGVGITFEELSKRKKKDEI